MTTVPGNSRENGWKRVLQGNRYGFNLKTLTPIEDTLKEKFIGQNKPLPRSELFPFLHASEREKTISRNREKLSFL